MSLCRHPNAVDATNVAADSGWVCPDCGAIQAEPFPPASMWDVIALDLGLALLEARQAAKGALAIYYEPEDLPGIRMTSRTEDWAEGLRLLATTIRTRP